MRRFGNSDKITEAKEVLTLIRGELASSQTVGSSSGIPQAQYVTLATNATLTAERVLTAGDGIDLTDGGAGSTVTLAVDVTDILGSGLTETSNNIDLNWGTPTIGTIEPDDSEDAGAGTNPARSDHQHAIVCGAPGADSVNVAASAEGSGTSFARADHTHNLDESITPTWTGAHTFDDGTGDSPAVNFVGGTNNDTAKIYLADDATATDSDLIIQLCDTAGDSVLGIHDSTPAAVLEIDSNGNVEMQNDGTWIGRGAASARIEFNAAGNAVKLYSGADLELYSDAGSTQVGLWDGATGNITLVDDAWIGLGAASTRVIFDSTSGNSLDLYSAADLRLFSDAGSTQVGLWDGATGDILLDDGSGDSPAVQFIGGTNNDTIKIFLDDDAATAGGSDLNVQLSDNAGASNFEIWDSTPASVLAIDSNGNIEFRLDDSWIGLGAAAGRIIFDNTPAPDVVRIKNANLVLTSDSGTDVLTIRRSGDVQSTESDIYANNQMGLASDSQVYIFIDGDNSAANSFFAIMHDADDVDTATELFRVDEAGSVLPGSAKTQDLGSATLEWDNIYYVTANTGTSRLIESSKICPVCDNQMSKGTGSLNIRGEDADYELVFCLQCGNAAVEVRNQQTTEMLLQRKPPPQVVLNNVRVNSLGGRDYRVMLDFDYGDGITNSTRLGDNELAALKTMTPKQRKAFIRQLGEREWYAREENRILQKHVSDVQAIYEPLMNDIMGLNLIQ